MLKETSLQNKTRIVLTKSQYQLLKKIQDNFTWIAKDEDGVTVVYSKKPCKHMAGRWEPAFWETFCRVISISAKEYDFINWNDNDPWKIEEILNNCIID